MNRYAYSNFCDDIRYEVGFKTSLLGLYGSHLLLPQLPFAIPKLCIVAFCNTPADEPFKSLSTRIYFGDKLLAEQVMSNEDLTNLQAQKEFDTINEPIERFTVGFNLILDNLLFEKAGVLKVIMLADGIEYIAGKLRINSQDQHIKNNE